MKILMVTPYPPARDGIAAYAVQSVARLRAEGHHVEVLSPGPSAAHHHLHLVGPRGALALAKRVRRYDRVIVQFHPDVFFPVPASPAQWRAESLALLVAFKAARDVEVRVHEMDYSRGEGRRGLRFINRLPWRTVHRIVVHTEFERERFVRAFGVRPERIAVTAHGAHFQRCTDVTKAEARATLGLPPDDIVFLHIGFIQPHKGFDRGVRALAEIAQAGGGRPCRLDIVGSVRTEDPGFLAYRNELRALVEATSGVFLHEGYVSPELFDRWLVASDVVVLPYRSIWSSGVLERALLYDRPVIATDVGGLSFQSAARAGVVLVDGDTGLARAMGAVVGVDLGDDPGLQTPALWGESVASDHSQLQAEVRRRAALRRRPVGPTGTLANGAAAEAAAGSDAVRRVSPLVLPVPGSAYIGGRAIKRWLGRLLAWQIEPLVHQVNRLRQATIEAFEAFEADESKAPPGPGGIPEKAVRVGIVDSSR